MRQNFRKQIGGYGENIVAGYLQAKGYSILETNYVQPNIGEIDIVAKQGDYIVFVEVKYRRNLRFGRPAEAITKQKIKNLRNCAEYYLYEKVNSNALCRFDVIEVFGKEKVEINHIVDAF